LGREDAKFFLINISPSQKEISHLKELYGEAEAQEKLQEYAVKGMDAYARILSGAISIPIQTYYGLAN
jgi:RNAse (barnase) inhibitor barstar